MTCNQNNKQQRKAIIAGGTGFIGQRVLKLFQKKGIKCYVISRQNIRDKDEIIYINADLNGLSVEKYAEINKNFGPFDVGIHLAASIPQIGAKKENYNEASNNTLVPTIKFIEGVAPYVNKVIYASSIDVVGVPKDNFYDESIETYPTTPYALAKLCGEFYVKSIAQKHNITYSILRFSQVYGPNEPLVRVIPILIKIVKEKNNFTLYGAGDEKRRFLYVEDAAISVLKAFNSKIDGTFNIAGKSIDSIRDLIEMVQYTYNTRILIEQKNVNTTVYDNIPSIEKAERILLFKPKYSLKEGIKKIFEEESNEPR